MPRLELASDTENEHSDDSAGEKEAKRQRSEPTTPVSTSSRHPYDYDALMGITRVAPETATAFSSFLKLEGLESLENPESGFQRLASGLLRNIPSTAGNSVAGSEKPFPEPLLTSVS